MKFFCNNTLILKQIQLIWLRQTNISYNLFAPILSRSYCKSLTIHDKYNITKDRLSNHYYLPFLHTMTVLQNLNKQSELGLINKMSYVILLLHNPLSLTLEQCSKSSTHDVQYTVEDYKIKIENKSLAFIGVILI